MIGSLVIWVKDLFKIVRKQVKLDAVVLDKVTFASVSIVFFDADLLILAWAVYKVAAEHYHTLGDSEVEEERADYAKPSFMRSWAFKMNCYGVTINVHLENLRLDLFQTCH